MGGVGGVVVRWLQWKTRSQDILGHARNSTLLRWKEAIYIHTNKPINQPSLLLNHTILRATNLLASRLPLQPPDNNPSDATHSHPHLPVDELSHNPCPG